MTVESTPGKGTAFHVYLPVAPAQAPPAPEVANQRAAVGRDRLVLLVDDEEPVRNTCRMVLERHGYRVVTAANGHEALELYEQHRDDIAAVLTDVMMPVMDGVKLIAELRRRSPALKAVAMTGMASEDKHRELAAHGVVEFLLKPCGPYDLLKAVERELARTPAPSIG